MALDIHPFRGPCVGNDPQDLGVGADGVDPEQGGSLPDPVTQARVRPHLAEELLEHLAGCPVQRASVLPEQ